MIESFDVCLNESYSGQIYFLRLTDIASYKKSKIPGKYKIPEFSMNFVSKEYQILFVPYCVNCIRYNVSKLGQLKN